MIGPEKRTVITLDMDLHERAMKIQLSSGNTNWFLWIGELHTCFAALHALGKYVENSGIDTIAIELGIYSPATLRQIFSGKSFNRGVQYCLTNLLALFKLMQDESIWNDPMMQVQTLDSQIYLYIGDIVHKCWVNYQSTIEDHPSAKFLVMYMNQVMALLHLIRATREANMDLYVSALDENVKYFFAHDLYKYGRLVPVHIAQLQELKTTSPDTWSDLCKGDMSVKRSGVYFTDLFVDPGC